MNGWTPPPRPSGVGITAFAADALGDVVWIDIPVAGTQLVHGEVCGEIESTKSVGNLYAPASAVVVEGNDRLNDEPELVNREPYGVAVHHDGRRPGSCSMRPPTRT